MDEILKLIQQALVAASTLQTLIPQIEQEYQTVKDALGSHDDTAVRAQIDTLHEQTSSLTAQLDALRDPPADA